MITPLPDPPSRADPSTFAAKGDAFVAALPKFGQELNDASSAFGLSIMSSSTTSLVIGTGSKTITTATDKGYITGMEVVISYNATSRMVGTIDTYDSGTGELVVEVTSYDGSGTYAVWSIGPTLAVNFDGREYADLRLIGAVTEAVYAITGTTPAISPANGPIQTWALSGNSTPTAGTWGAGQSITLMVDDGSAYTVTWTSLAVTWKTDAGAAPTLNTSGYTAIALWKVGSTIYGARVGDA